MNGFRLCLQVAVLLAGVAALTCAEVKDKRQVGTEVAQEDDRDTAETGFAEAVQAGSKYFQYAHVPAKDHSEFGHRRGNEHHFTERHEKAHPHAGQFKTKVRWGDKHGGYDEHYWDYNHAGHGHGHGQGHGQGHGHDGGGHGGHKEAEYVAYEGSEPLPVVAKSRQRRDLLENGDVEFISDKARSLVESGAASKHGGNYRYAPADTRVKRNRQNYTPKFGIDVQSELFPESEGQKLFKFVKENY